jgi:uncharacterized protein (TIGR00299 family) protein
VDVRVEEGHAHHHEGHAHHHAPHRNLHDIRRIIEGADLSASVKSRAIDVFTRLGQAEAKVHGTTVEQVHFHEVGALDAIVDIVGAAAGLEALGIDKLHASAVPLGSGWVQTSHGRLPVPAPATLELLASAAAPTTPGPGEGELVTPTGAAILAALATFGRPPMQLRRIALGAGQKDFAWPNVARLWLGEPAQKWVQQGDEPLEVVLLQANIDDMNPQLYAAASDGLFAAGAIDVWLAPVQMKKGRPGVVLSVLGRPEDENLLADAMLRQTTTLGVRVSALRRHVAQREFRQVQTPLGSVRAKLKIIQGRIVGAAPEYEDCRALAEQQGQPVRVVYEAALAAAQELVR